MFKSLDGYKTHITAIVTAVIGILNMSGISVPEYVLYLLGAFGLYAVRDAIKKVEK